jgi:hypothetical protein
LIVSSFHEGINLISFSLAEVFVFYKQQRHARSRSLECYTSSATQPSVNQSCTSCLNSPYKSCFQEIQNDRSPVKDWIDLNGTVGDTCFFDLDCGTGSVCVKSFDAFEGVCLRKKIKVN